MKQTTSFSQTLNSVSFYRLIGMIVLLMLPFYGCKHDDLVISPTETLNTQQPQKSYITVEKAKAYFDEQVAILKKEKAQTTSSLTNESTEATFDGLDVTPQWNNARIVNRDFISFVEVPFIFADGSQLITSISRDTTINISRKSASSLVISSNSRGAMSSSFMRVAADNDFLNNQGTLANFTYNQVPSQFKGIETYYDIRGNFKNGWHFSQGRIDGLVKKSRSAVAGSRCQSWNVCEEVGRTIQLGTPGSGVGAWVNIRYDCTLYTVGFCNGWQDYEYANINTWGGPIDTEWGNCDQTCQEYAMFYQIVDNLSHPCLQNIFNQLKQDHLLSTLQAFNNDRLPNITLTFSERSRGGDTIGVTSGFRDQYITLDYDKMSSSTDLFVAAIMIHETIHAYLQYYFAVVNPSAIYNYRFNNPNSSQEPEYKVFMDAYIANKVGDTNQSGHDQMEATFLSYIELALVRFSGAADPVAVQACKDLAWAGLNYNKLPRSDRERIDNRIKAERYNRTEGLQFPKGAAACP